MRAVDPCAQLRCAPASARKAVLKRVAVCMKARTRVLRKKMRKSELYFFSFLLWFPGKKKNAVKLGADISSSSLTFA
jgi:hypothetical protein